MAKRKQRNTAPNKRTQKDSMESGDAGESLFPEGLAEQVESAVGQAGAQLSGVSALPEILNLATSVAGGTLPFDLIDKGIAALLERFEEWQVEMKSLSELQHEMNDPGLVSHVYDLAQAFAEGENSTARWLDTFRQLHQLGAGEHIQQLGEHVKVLAQKMGGDLKGATAIAAAELSGNWEPLKQFGVVVDKDAPLPKKLEQAGVQFATKKRSSAGDIHDASSRARSLLRETEREMQQNSGLMNQKIASLSRAQTDREQQRATQDRARLSSIQDQLRDGQITPAKADEQVFDLKKSSLTEKFGSRRETLFKQKEEYQGQMEEQSAALGQMAREIEESETIVKQLTTLGGADQDSIMKFAKFRDILFRKNNGTMNGADVMEMQKLASGETGNRLRQQFGNNLESPEAFATFQQKAAILNQLPENRRDLGIEQAFLNASKDQFNAIAGRTYERIKRFQERMNELDRSIDQGEQQLGEALQKLNVEQGKKRTGTQQRTTRVSTEPGVSAPQSGEKSELTTVSRPVVDALIEQTKTTVAVIDQITAVVNANTRVIADAGSRLRGDQILA